MFAHITFICIYTHFVCWGDEHTQRRGIDEHVVGLGRGIDEHVVVIPNIAKELGETSTPINFRLPSLEEE